MGNICWFTNLDFEKRHERMVLFRNYSPENIGNAIASLLGMGATIWILWKCGFFKMLKSLF